MSALHLTNPMRYLVPVGTAALLLVMFIPPLAFLPMAAGQVIAGIVIFTALLVWLAWSAWNVPFEMSIDGGEFIIRRWAGERRYAIDHVRKWWFAIPDAPPTKSPPETNGVLYVVFDDRTRFRGEVTAEEAQRIVTLFPAC